DVYKRQLLVSHDRYFLDVTVREVYELFNGTLTRYVGTYTQYETRRSQELEALFDAWERQQEEIQRIEDFIRRFRYKESKAPQVQSRIKMLEKMTRIEIPEGMKRIHFSFPPAPRSGQAVVRIRDLSKSYGTRMVIDRFSLDVERGTKLALVGPNGAGKSTLMRIIAGVDANHEGSVTYGANVCVGYFSQDSAEQMESNATVLDLAEASCPPALLPKLNNLLGAFLFRGDDLEKPISVLSGGERSRLALLTLLLHPSNLLVLDEPTNHLDLTSKDILLEALRSFEGTVVFVSHDRQFLDELADRVLELSCGRVPKLYYGNYAYYLEKKTQESALASEGIQPSRQSEERPAASTRSWEEEKARKARLRKLHKREEEIAARLEAIAHEKNQLETELARPDVYIDGARTRRILADIASLDEEVERLNNEWLEVAESLAGEEAL
ncbi:MAG: ATP-binding cassette domain-containing protein, partial [Rectinema sp.]|nr:ATP-binding cassette domain-containing protein [Rectinema sp.]